MPAWNRALAFALTGQLLDLPDADAPDVEALLGSLEGLGWDAARVGELVAEAAASGRPWPVPLPDELRQGLGAAQMFAALTAARHAWGLEGVAAAPSHRTQLTPDERRLLIDVPPHHLPH